MTYSLPRHKYKKAWEWRQELDAGSISCESITQTYLEKIAADKTNSFITVCADEALSKARDYDKGKGFKGSPLSGIPVGLKDILLTKGVRTTCGSKMLEDYIPPYSATVVDRLESLGAISVGKLNMDEFAMGSSGENSAFGATMLPQDLARIPGGSSSGSAAAIAGDLVPITLGTDTGGSVRQPASFCGVVGLKPTYGRVSRYGVIAFASSLDQVGPLALDSQDCADLFDSIAGGDPLDSTSISGNPPSTGKSVHRIRTSAQEAATLLRNTRIGYYPGYFTSGLDSGVQKKVEQVIEEFKKAGARMVPIDLPHSRLALAVYYIIAMGEASSNLARYDGIRYGSRVSLEGKNKNKSLKELYGETRGKFFGTEVKRRILLGTFVLSAGYYDAYYKKACSVQELITQDFAKAFSQCHAIISPTTPTVSFLRGETSDPLQMYLNDIYTAPINLAGLPAISFPWGTGEHNLPVGVQLIGAPFQEEKLLLLTAALEGLYDKL